MHAFQLQQPHENRVSSLQINPKGDALCTASWDTVLKVMEMFWVLHILSPGTRFLICFFYNEM
jgi:hypothetical protein